jgi:anti-anti-sigma regulatory factor
MEAIVRLNGRIDVDSSPDIRDCLLAILSGKQLVHVVTVDLVTSPILKHQESRPG